MEMISECPGYTGTGSTYECPLLQATRKGEDEEICSFCEEIMDCRQQNKDFERAFVFAEKSHEGQYRKGTTIPYMIHLVRTWHYVSRMTKNSDICIAALLHDVLEDTTTDESKLRETFGEAVAELVAGESETKRKDRPAGETWQLRKQETIERLQMFAKEEDGLASMQIAFADKLANLFSMMHEYRRIGDFLWKKFNQKDKTMHAWYYGEMGHIFEEFFGETEPELVKEYQTYYREVFQES